MRHPFLTMMKSQWKQRQKHDQNFPMGGNIVEQTPVLEEINQSKRAGVWEPGQGSKYES